MDAVRFSSTIFSSITGLSAPNTERPKTEIIDLIKFADDNNLTLITTEKDIVKIPKKYHLKIKYLKMKIEFDKNDLISLRLLIKQKLND